MSAIPKIQLERGPHGEKDPNDYRDDPEKFRRILSGAFKARLPFMFPRDLTDIAPTEFLINQWIERETVNLLYAPKDSYKSFVVLDMALSVASGKPWHGHEVQKGTVVYIAGEGNRGYRRRLRAWCIRHNSNLLELPIAVSTRPTEVLDPDVMEKWREHIKEVLVEIGPNNPFVVIDTLATNFGPGDENAPGDMARFIAQLRIHLVEPFKATVLVVHHTGKDIERGARGGSAIEGNADAVFRIERDKENDGVVHLVCKHAKDESRADRLTFASKVVELGIDDSYGDPMTSLVLDLFLTERQNTILAETKNGRSERGIAQMLGKSKGVVTREKKLLRNMGKLP